MSVAKNIFLIIASPKLGWKEVNDTAFPTTKVIQSGFVPLLAVLAVASFVPILYDSNNWPFAKAIIHAIAGVSSFLVAYYLATYLLGGVFPFLVRSNSATTRLHNFVLYNLAYLVVLEICKNLLNQGFTPLDFLCLYTLVITSKGLEWQGVKDDKQHVVLTLFASALFVLVPLVVMSILEIIYGK